MTDFTNKVISEPQSNQYVELINSSGNPFYILASDLKTYTNTQAINEDAEVTGVSAGTTTTYLSYGVNVVTTADASNYSIRLPYPPIKGRTVTIINTTTIPIVVYPSITGGSINGVVNGTATIPADNNAYTFTCWENPLPGAWSWTAPAINQYDSGEVTLLTASATDEICAINTVLFGDGDSGASSGIAYGGRLKAPFVVTNTGTYEGYFKPSSFWNSATKIKVYTNANLEATYTLFSSYGITYYDIATGAVVTNGPSGSGNVISATGCDQLISGTLVPIAGNAYLSANIGDDATRWGELSIAQVYPTAYVGDKYIGQQLVSGTLRDVWFCQYYKFIIEPHPDTNDTDFKFRFFIEHT